MNTRDVHFKNRPTGKGMKSRLNSDIELVGKVNEEILGSCWQDVHASGIELSRFFLLCH